MSAGPLPTRQKRLRGPASLPEAVSIEFGWALRRAEHHGVSVGEVIQALIETAPWQQVMRPACEALDAQTRSKTFTRRYSAEEIEIVMLFGLAHGKQVPEDVRKEFASDEHAADRQLLGFTHQRFRRPGQKRMIGVPSAPTIRRHLRRFGDQNRNDAWSQLIDAMRELHLEQVEGDPSEQLAIFQMDGKDLPSHYPAPKYDAKTGECVNAPRSEVASRRRRGWSAPDLGYRGAGADGEHPTCNGARSIFILANGLCFAHATGKANDSERGLANQALDYLAEKILPKAPLPDGKLRVLTADGGFSGRRVMHKLQGMGIVPNIHYSSHKDGSVVLAEKARAKRIPIRGYDKWFVDGHRQLHCACGQEQTSFRAEPRKGKAVTRVEGRCHSCGTISITAGQWRLSKNPAKYVRMLPGDPPEEADWSLGNGLTFDSPLAREYGKDRFGQNEGFNGAWQQRFGATKWTRTQAAFDTQLCMAFVVMFALDAECRRKRREAATSAPPPTPLPRRLEPPGLPLQEAA